MFFIFGWIKESEHKGSVLNTYCYHCNSVTDWHRFTETEWVTFFDIKTMPIKNTHHLSCDRCHDMFALSRAEAKKIINLHRLGEIQKQQLHEVLVTRLETQQLSGKSERQLEYIRVMREMQEQQDDKPQA